MSLLSPGTVIYAGAGGQTGRPYPGDTGLPKHNGGGPDQKPPRPTPQFTAVANQLPPRLPPKIHGPNPGPLPNQ